jgi:hypothetical protein
VGIAWVVTGAVVTRPGIGHVRGEPASSNGGADERQHARATLASFGRLSHKAVPEMLLLGR